MAPRGWLLVPVLLAAVVSGCGAGDDGPTASSSSLDFLPGERVGQLAEEQPVRNREVFSQSLSG